MCSFTGAFVCGLIFAIVDMLQGLSVLIFYSYQQFVHRHCTYAHGVLACEYFLFKSNHSIRVMIGIGEGLVCMMFSGYLIYALHKRYGSVVFIWLLKPIGVLSINLYFVGVWLVQRGRYYHTYDSQEEVYQELLYIYFGVTTALLQVLLALWYCCAIGGFTVQIRKLQRSEYSSCETKV